MTMYLIRTIIFSAIFLPNYAISKTTQVTISGGGGGGTATLPPVQINYNQYNKYGIIPFIIDLIPNHSSLDKFKTDLKKIYDPNYRVIQSQETAKDYVLMNINKINVENGTTTIQGLLSEIQKIESQLNSKLSRLNVVVSNNKQKAKIIINRSIKYGDSIVHTWATPINSDSGQFDKSAQFVAQELNVNHALQLKISYDNKTLTADNDLKITIKGDFEQQCVKVKGSDVQLCVQDLSLIYDDIFWAIGKRADCNPYSCTHAQMPIMSQLSKSLYGELEKDGESFEIDKNGNKVDTFACGAVTTAMILTSAAKEIKLKQKTNSYSIIQQLIDAKLTNSEKEIIYAKMSVISGKLVKTNYKNTFKEKNAGTDLSNITPGYLKFWNHENTNKLTNVQFHPKNKGVFSTYDISGQLNTLISKYNFFNTLPHVNLLVSNDPNSWGHYVVWHGFDTHSHIAFDPYGRITRFRINHQGQIQSDLKSGTVGHEQNLRIIGVAGLNTQNAVLD